MKLRRAYRFQFLVALTLVIALPTIVYGFAPPRVMVSHKHRQRHRANLNLRLQAGGRPVVSPKGSAKAAGGGTEPQGSEQPAQPVDPKIETDPPTSQGAATNSSTAESPNSDSKPIPTGVAVASKTVVSPALRPAPALDDWDKYVIRYSEHYQFTAEQSGRAQSVLRDLKQRAVQYRMSRSLDFDNLVKIADEMARLEAQKKLNLPIDTLFHELQQRLESLLTLEQKAKPPFEKSAPVS